MFGCGHSNGHRVLSILLPSDKYKHTHTSVLQKNQIQCVLVLLSATTIAELTETATYLSAQCHAGWRSFWIMIGLNTTCKFSKTRRLNIRSSLSARGCPVPQSIFETAPKSEDFIVVTPIDLVLRLLTAVTQFPQLF